MPNRDTTATCSLDQDLRYISGNEAFFALVGRSREEIIGRKYLEVFPQLEGGEGHLLLLKALHTMQPQRTRIHSPLVNKLIDCEIHPLSGVLQATMRVVEDGES